MQSARRRIGGERKLKLAATGRGIAPLLNAARTAQRAIPTTTDTKRCVDAYGWEMVGTDLRFCSGNGKGWEKGEKIPSKFPAKVGTESAVLLGKWKGGGNFPAFPATDPLRVRNAEFGVRNWGPDSTRRRGDAEYNKMKTANIQHPKHGNGWEMGVDTSPPAPLPDRGGEGGQKGGG
jgi:hypothetical protein